MADAREFLRRGGGPYDEPHALRIVLRDRSERDGITDAELQGRDGLVLGLLAAAGLESVREVNGRR